MSPFSKRLHKVVTMNEKIPLKTGSFDWSHVDTRRRQERVGLEMTPAERLLWLEEILDELLPLVGRARAKRQTPETTRR